MFTGKPFLDAHTEGFFASVSGDSGRHIFTSLVSSSRRSAKPSTSPHHAEPTAHPTLDLHGLTDSNVASLRVDR